MFCPRCGSEYVDSIIRCRDCDEDLVDHPAPVERLEAPAPRREDDEPVEIYRAHGETDAHLMRSLLEGHGIRAVVGANVLASSVYRFTVGKLSEMSVCVPRRDVKRAREVVRAATKGHLRLPGSD